MSYKFNVFFIVNLFFFFFNNSCKDLKETKVDKKIESKSEVDNKPPKIENQKKNIFNPQKKEKKIRKEFKELTIEELEFNKQIVLKEGDKEGAARFVDRQIVTSKDHNQICNLRLELADLYYDLDLMEKSGKAYGDFIRDYPGHEKTDYASYKLISSLFRQSKIPDRDQAETREALRLSKQFLSKRESEAFNKYKKQVKFILEECEKKLLEAEINIFKFYLKNKKLQSAEKRLENIRKEYDDPKNEELFDELEEELKARKQKRKYVPKKIPTISNSVSSNTPKKKKSYGDRF